MWSVECFPANDNCVYYSPNRVFDLFISVRILYAERDVHKQKCPPFKAHS